MLDTTIFYDKAVTCKLCGHEFATKQILTSHLRVEKRDSDLCTHYKNGLSPYYYEISVCPSCGFAFSESFAVVSTSLRGSVSETYALYRPESSRDLCGERSIDDAILTFELALRSGFCAKEDSLFLAGICLRLAWLYRDMDNEERERVFLSAANRYYVDVYTNGKDDDNLASVLHMLAETSARIGAHAEARRWFGMLFDKQFVSYPYLSVAKDAWIDSRQQASTTSQSSE